MATNPLWNKLKSLLKASEQRPAELPFIHETFDFTDIPDFDEYIQEEFQYLLNNVKSEYLESLVGDHSHSSIGFFNDRKSQGFAIACSKYTFSRMQYLILIKGFMSKLKAVGYVKNLSEIKTRSKAHWTEQVVKVYLKPAARLRITPPAQQLYGNIQMELISRDQELFRLRLLAHTYQDQNFAPAEDFGELIDLLMS